MAPSNTTPHHHHRVWLGCLLFQGDHKASNGHTYGQLRRVCHVHARLAPPAEMYVCAHSSLSLRMTTHDTSTDLLARPNLPSFTAEEYRPQCALKSHTFTPTPRCRRFMPCGPIDRVPRRGAAATPTRGTPHSSAVPTGSSMPLSLSTSAVCRRCLKPRAAGR